MTYESNLELKPQITIKGNDTHQQYQDITAFAVRKVLSNSDPVAKRNDWIETYKYMTEHEVFLSPTTWMVILEDKDLVEVIDQHEERYQAILKAMPHSSGYPMRVNGTKFRPELYVDGKWVGLEAIKDPEPDLVEQQMELTQMKEFLDGTEDRIAEGYAVIEEMKATLDYDDAMRVVDRK